ncbi:MAG: ester cyclase [Planctomycetota bacterium]
MPNHKETSKHFIQLWGDNTPHLATDYVAPGYVNHQLPDAFAGTSTLDFAQWQALVKDFHEKFSDVRADILLQVAEGEYVSTRFEFTATNTGPFDDHHPATGNTSTWTGTQTDRYQDGKLVESWVDWDKYSFLKGLGLID